MWTMHRQVRYTPSTSKRGRQLRKAKGAREADPQLRALTLEQLEWNARVERKRKKQ